MEVTTRANTPFPAGNGAADSALTKTAASLHGAVDKAAGAADGAARQVKPAIDRAAEAAHQTVERFANVAAPTAAWLNERGSDLKARQRTLTADTELYVAAHPWKSLGFAVAAGFLLSRFIR